MYFESDEVHACIVTCGGLCPGLNTVIREIVCGLYHMYGVHKVLGIEVGTLICYIHTDTLQSKIQLSLENVFLGLLYLFLFHPTLLAAEGACVFMAVLILNVLNLLDGFVHVGRI